jgi:signal transduction histidine kinase
MASVRAGSFLAHRMLIASCVLSTVAIGTFVVLHATITSLGDSASLANRSEAALISADRLGRLVAGLEVAQRGFITTGDKRYLGPWNVARAAFPEAATDLRKRSDADSAGQAGPAAEIVRAGTSYLRDYSVPLMEAAQRNPLTARSDPQAVEGEHRFNDLQARVDGFVAAQRAIVAARSARAGAAAARAANVSAGGTAAMLLLILLVAGYLNRAVLRPVRRAAALAGDVAGGDPTIRVPETSPGEIGVLERAFNSLAGTLETNQAAARRNAEEQQALRRVATLVAQGVSPEQIFTTVASEMGRVLGATYSATVRFEPDSTMTMLGAWGSSGTPEPIVPIGSRWSMEGESVGARIARTGKPARVTDYGDSSSDIGRWSHTHGFKSGVGSPIVVDRRLWGMVIVLSMCDEPLPAGTEVRMLEFTKLIGTAIANTESREELRASRARVVTAADETRRRFERNLHDGAQQHLISLGLQLRAIEDLMPTAQARQRLSAACQRLTDILEELREISRGLHPAVLSRGGLGPALKALQRRSPVPIELDINVPDRPPQVVEVAVYYTISEAVANVAKHANASGARVVIEVRNGAVHLSVRDDGVGGADFGNGSGLIGIRDRVEALGGRLSLTSPGGKGTALRAEIPIS